MIEWTLLVNKNNFLEYEYFENKKEAIYQLYMRRHSVFMINDNEDICE